MRGHRLRKVLIVISAFIVIIAVSSVFMFRGMEKKLDSIKTINFASLDMSAIGDGTYTGSADGGMVQASVEVTVKDHKITNVKILSHKNGKGKPAEVIVDDIVSKNSVDVDAISGATASSYVLKAAVLNALTK